jgi:hypothetical protein
MNYISSFFYRWMIMNGKMTTSLIEEGPLKKFLFSSLATLLVVLALPVASIFAASVTSQEQKNNCVEQISPLRAGQVSSSVLSIKCFATFSQSIAFATNGAIHLSTAVTPRDLTAAQMRNASVHPFTTVTIGILYDQADLVVPPSLIVTGTSGCSSSDYADYGISTLSTYGWDKVVSSLEGDNGCTYTTLYTDTGYHQSASDPSECFKNTANTLPSMDNQASSVIWGGKDPTTTGYAHIPTLNNTTPVTPCITN